MQYLNIIIVNGNNELNDRFLFFPEDEEVQVLSNVDMFDLLVMLGSFENRSQARKNWKQTDKNIPLGFSSFTIGKLKRELTILNPKG